MGTDAAAGFGEVLRVFRIAAGLSQEELAERAGLSGHGISDLERGARTRPYAATVQRLALALGLSSDELAQLRIASRVAPTADPTRPSLPSRARNEPTPPPMVGRTTELQRILSALETAVASRRGRLVMLAGEPGVGKTRLAREVLARATTLGARTSMGRCFEQYTGVPFFPFTEALAVPLVGPSLLSDRSALARWPDLAGVLADADSNGPSQDAHRTQLRVFRAVTAFLAEVAETSPLVLVLDDLHWADATSLSLLLYLGRHLGSSRIFVLGAYRDVGVDRDNGLEETLRELLRERLMDEVRLRPLGPDGTAGLIRQQFSTQIISDEFVALVHARAAGNPFFTEELLRALVEEGGVGQGQARWGSDAVARLEVPRSVRSVVMHRASRLPPETQELLLLASAIGQELELELLMAVSGQTETAVLDQLDPALAGGMLRETHGGGRDRYAFVHALVQQALYAGLASSRRRQLHRAIGDALEHLQPARPVAAAELARHFLAAGEVERAIGYALRAGDEASARYAHAEAANWYRELLNLYLGRGELAQAAGVQLRLAAELYDLNRLADALAAYEAALSAYEGVNDALGQARAHRGIALLHRGRYDFAAAMPHFEAALRVWPPEREDAELASIQVDGARAGQLSGDFATAHSLAASAVGVAERSNAPGLLAQSLMLLAQVRFGDDPRPAVLLELLNRAEDVARSGRDWRALSYVYVMRASFCDELAGHLDRALADRRAAVDAAERSGDSERQAFASRMLAGTYLDMGLWNEGRIVARKASMFDPEGVLKGFPDSELLTWMEGRVDDTMAYMAAYVADARARRDRQGLSISLVYLADMLLQLDRLVEAEAPAREAADLLRVGGGWSPWPGIGWGPAAETVVRLGTPDAAHILATAEHDVASTGQVIAQPQLLRARGLLLERQGQPDAAIQALLASAELARSQHAGIQLGRTLDALIALARKRSDAALATQTETELARLVERIGQEIGALPWARRGVVSSAAQPAGAHARSGSREPIC